MRSVAVIAFDGISPFHLSVPTLVLGRSGTGAHGTGAPYDVAVCAETTGTLATAAGFDITVRHGLDAIAAADLVVFPGWERGRGVSPALREAVRAAHARGAQLTGLCLGAWAIADTGLADGRVVTTHWAAAEDLARAYPRVRVRADTLWTDLGDLLTSAGVAAALDCCLHIVRKDHGARVATELARDLVTAPHRSGSQAQFIPVAVPNGDPDGDDLEHAMVWARTHLDATFDLDAWARTAHMSRRTFTRRFRARTGTSPQQWLLQQRTDRARLLLETTDDTVDRIAGETGFGSAVSLRHHFHRALGVAPAVHRAQFRGTVAGTGTAGPGR
ncbi:GlxA family transcriptional regulator [Nocardia thailandica]|uniref:GlxA family transcriptional regulator n=1 Tax=Nocardia thailandica TaxID=257275 RepID=UPI000310034C|nr:helix-turn-helix domain-containing protein [Nocardia thailandica]